jgi:prepilin-type N-terminal cleavage/methylation domain-containing protein
MTMLSKMNQVRKNQKGFTLVEVIVVAVIVAVLALVAIMLYQGYTKDARKNTAENLAASAAGYLQAERNRGTAITVETVTGPNTITIDTAGTGVTPTVFTVPRNATVAITGTSANGGTVSATVGTAPNQGVSSSYNW